MRSSTVLRDLFARENQVKIVLLNQIRRLSFFGVLTDEGTVI